MPTVKFKTTKMAERAEKDPLLYEILRDIGVSGNDLVKAHDALLARVAILEALIALKTDGSGTTGRLAKWTGSLTLGDSIVTESGAQIGLNTTVPATVLHLVNDAVVAGSSVLIDAYGASPIIRGRHANGSAASPTATALDDSLTGLTGRGYGATGFAAANRVEIRAHAAQAWTDTAQGTYVVIRTTTNGTASQAERVRFTDNGRVRLNNGPEIITGTGTPESVVTAVVGSLFLRTDGGAGTTLYVKESGTGNTGWAGK